MSAEGRVRNFSAEQTSSLKSNLANGELERSHQKGNTLEGPGSVRRGGETVFAATKPSALLWSVCLRGFSEGGTAARPLGTAGTPREKNAGDLSKSFPRVQISI